MCDIFRFWIASKEIREKSAHVVTYSYRLSGLLAG